MAIFFFKIKVITQVMLYMFLSIFVYLGRDLRKSKGFDAKGPFTPVHWAYSCYKYGNASLKTLGRENLSSVDWSRNVFFVCNHASYFDIPSVILATEKVVGFVAKYELTRIPIVHYWMKKIGCIAINRKEYTSAIRNLTRLQETGHPSHLVIFPEGTRSKNGQLGNLKAGGLKIAWQLEAILLPIHIKGTRKVWEARKSQTQSHTVTVSLSEPIDLRHQKKDKSFSEFFKEFELSFKTMHQNG